MILLLIQQNKVQDNTYALDLCWAQFGFFEDLQSTIDLILAADCLYEPSKFEDFVATVTFLLKPTGSCWMTYHNRNEDRTLAYLLDKWKLKAEKDDALYEICSEEALLAAGFAENDALRIEQSVEFYRITKLP